MHVYREANPRATDLETAAIYDLLARIKTLRRRVALPLMIAGVVAALFGMGAHVTGRWSILGRLDDGGYYVSGVTILVAAFLSAAPIVAPGAAVYVGLRGRARRSWREAHVANGLSPSFLAENMRRFG